jgi:hypothetical protein
MSCETHRNYTYNTMTQVRTLYACVGEHETELSFEPNQIITSGKFLDLFLVSAFFIHVSVDFYFIVLAFLAHYSIKMFLFLFLSTFDLIFFLLLLTDQHIQFAVISVVDLHPDLL